MVKRAGMGGEAKSEIFYIDAEIRFRLENGKSFLLRHRTFSLRRLFLRYLSIGAEFI